MVDLETIQRRIEENAYLVNGCWIWRGKFRGNKPIIRTRRKDISVIHAVFSIYKNQILGKLKTYTTCNDPSCIKPEHLKVKGHVETVD